MQSRPYNGAKKSQPISKFRKVLFGAACLVSFFCICYLFSLKNSTQNAMNGELITDAQSSDVVVSTDNSFISVIFDYFGNVTYFFPLLFVYLGYKIAIKKFVLKEVDFFFVGIFILGFDLLVLGLCALFSALFSGSDSVPGGILGDFFNLFLSRIFPAPLSTLIPIVTTFLGLFLFTAKGPIWYCDKIGELITVLFSKITHKPIENNENIAPVVEPKTEAEQSVFDAPRDESLNTIIKPLENDRHVVKPNMSATPSFGGNSDASSLGGIKQGSSSVKTPSSFTGVPFPEFGGSTRDEFTKPVPVVKEEPKHTKKTSYKNQSHERIEPGFGSLESPLSTASRNVSKEGYVTPGVQLPTNNYDLDAIETTSSASTSFSNGPSTYITGASFSNTNQATVPDYKNYQEETDPVTTIIKDNRPTQVQTSNETVKKTVITRLKMDEPASSNQSNYNNEAQSDNSKTSTIIYKAGADHLPPTKVVGNPSRKAEVSTVITRTTLVPNVDTKVNTNTSTISGEYLQNAGEQLNNKSLNEGQKYENTSTSSSMFPSSEEIEENVINFADLANGVSSEPEKPLIKINNLSSAFIPTDDIKVAENNVDKDKLTPVASALIKESDSSFEKYSHASRGVNSNSSSQNSLSMLATSATDETAPAPSSFAGNNLSAQNVNSTSTFAEQAVATSTQNNINNTPYFEQNSVVNETEHTVILRGETPSLNTADVNIDPLSNETSSTYGNTQENEVPFGLRVEPKKNPITSMPTVKYSVSTETTPKQTFGDWRPPFSLLARSSSQGEFNNDDEVNNKITIIDNFLRDFNAKAKVADFVSGPVITRFDLNLEPGVKSNSICALNTDLQRSLMTNKINMLHAVPGTPYMGIEVPNDNRQTITLGDVVESDEFLSSRAYLPMCIGVDTIGSPVVADLAEAPHLLIAGTTGSGKSAGLNSMLVSLLLARSPAELRIIMVDPKTVEFTQYQGLPHLLTPIITDPEAATAALAWLVKEQERRYKLLSAMRVSNIHQCNALIKQEQKKGNVVYDPAWSADMGGEPPILKPIPYILLVVDEFADLMAMAAGSNKKGYTAPDALIGRLAAKARAAGIHLIVATQTPRSDIVTGQIRANMPSRIAYTVQNSTESRIILDENGAENLLGNGDMMIKYQKLRNSQLFRAHGPYASNEDVKNVVHEWIERAGEPEYVEGVTDILDEEEVEDTDSSDSLGSGKVDEKFDVIVDWIRTVYVAENKPLSISAIQTEHAIGFNKAKRIHNQLKKQGIIDKDGYIIN